MSAPIASDEAPHELDALINEWRRLWHENGLVGDVEHASHADDKGHYHWMIRLRGDEKDVIALWLTLRQRTVFLECEVMPAPEENREALFAYLLVKNADLRELHLAIGPEQGIYLVGQIPVGELTLARLDELVGATLHYVDEIYPTAMSMGLASLYRRRASRRTL
ncbi:MAG: YbjN domain-containing protein [Acidimicrobiales bacterium]